MIFVPTDPVYHLAFDALAWGSGIATGVLLYRWRLREQTEKIANVASSGYFVALATGAVIGAYVSGSITFWGQGIFALAHSVAGALVGATVGVELFKFSRGITFSTGIIFVGPFSIGVAIGRWGCLFAGPADQTMGSPSTVAWAVDLGDGIGRHPVQIYESLAMALFLAAFLVGLGIRANWAMRQGFYWLVITYGAQRFVWEFFKPYPAIIGPFNQFHLLCAALVVYGILMIRKLSHGEATQHEPPA